MIKTKAAPHRVMKKVGTAYILWLGGLVGLSGLHRIYNGEIRTGVLWLGTFGLFGVGQLMDLLLIPKMVKAQNAQLDGRYTAAFGKNTTALDRVLIQKSLPFPIATAPRLVDPVEPMSRQQATIELLKAAESRGGKLSVTQGVMATGLRFREVETLLKEMLQSGYVEIENDPETGIVLYEFKEML